MFTLKTGSTLKGGKYKIVKSIGQGSFGITYLATMSIEVDGQLGKIDVNVNVAIKEFFMSDLNSRSADGTSVEKTDSSLVKNYRTKFRREAENLSKLHHPNIVKVLEVFEENNTTYYVMEFIEGESLDDYIKRQGKLPEEEALSVAQNICSALSYMHGHKMLHLDLKPKNIMRDGEGHIRLIDFGLSKQYNENGEPESSTTLGLGTPGYAPIEQAHYKQDGTFPVTLDIYALGATLFKMLTGKTPPEATIMLEDGFPSDVLKQAGVSTDVTAIVEKAMAPMRKNRYQNVSSLSQAIEEISFTEHIDDEKTSFQEEKEEEIVAEPEVEKKPVIEPIQKPNVALKRRSTSKHNWTFGLIGVVLLIVIFIVGGILFDSNQTKPSSFFDLIENLKDTTKMADNKIEERKRKLYDYVSKDFDLGDYESFLKNFEDEGKRKTFYNTVKDTYGDKVRLGDWNQFNDALGFPSSLQNLGPSNNMNGGDQNVLDTLPKPSVQIFTVEGNGKTVTFKMIKVEAGGFQMGLTSGEDWEKPVHQVTISKDYYMGETEVTQALWYAVMAQSPTSDGSKWTSTYGKGDNYPAYYISYEDCEIFIRELNRKTGKNFRMPTEAEWEFAAKGGNKTRGYTYAGSNNINDVAWYSDNANDKIHPVGQKLPNELGLYDMSGNVWEWCNDFFGNYSSSAQIDPTGAYSSSLCVYRGGCWFYMDKFCHCAHRSFDLQTYRNYDLGLRLAL